MTPFEAIIYGVIQGLAWFIPISSDAHLEITSVLLSGHDIGAAFTAVIQWGTWVACVIYLWKDIERYARAFVRGIWENRPFATQDAKLAWMLLVGTVPIGVLGVLFKAEIETDWRRLIVVAVAAIVFALLLAAAEWVHRIRSRAGKPEKGLSDVGWGETLLVGFAQCVALIPGASRSGTTIAAGIFAGMSRDAAARYSFLLSLPAVFAAGLYELYKHQKELLHSQQDVLNLVIATVVAGVVGYASIWFLLRYLKTHTTWVFIGYRLVLGAVLLATILGGWLPNQPPKAPAAAFTPVHRGSRPQALVQRRGREPDEKPKNLRFPEVFALPVVRFLEKSDTVRTRRTWLSRRNRNTSISMSVHHFALSLQAPPVVPPAVS